MSSYTLPEDRSYTDEHIWLREDAQGLTVGISDFAQAQLEEVVYVDMPAVGSAVEAGKEFGSVESMKSVSALFSPVSGVVEAVNTDLENKPDLVNSDCYGQGWILRLRREGDNAVPLLSAEEYRTHLKSQA
ncbi:MULTISPECIES: glycine cleavage system protein GcvH [Desulfovibrio]|uniref:Glycine cleavage system H protein n=3 Tax=Desulfovibrio TaxID=872 RepID=A0AA94L2C9_DESDE|nr:MULTISPECIES: glycine cleavage system protein GcvH [Desulfovibrio]ATD80131.1 glycine cleavage system protein H [Desulfovibrio sp. G11]MDY0204548.1 glycine cleavage system protein GcvH [Desulfovibrio desulfuricans]SFW50704.1 glycine cleavage system H protein [Desulfovibrio desulfuricans]SPD35585.1 2-oxo acid dehydrogenase, lipoyl-binding site, H-Protein [Desulfovibrio sp. G11]